MKLDYEMHEKIFQGGNVLTTITATVGTYISDIWPVAVGLIGWGINMWLKWRKEQQEYRHREEKHQAELQNIKDDE